MMELLAVMVMIGIMAALASPSFIAVLRDRRVNRSAQSIAEVYRMARARALGRGAAVMIRWNKTGGSGSKPIFETYEAVVAAADAQPVSSCLTGFGAAGFTRRVNTLQPEGGLAELATVKLFDGGVERANADICFSPRGRTFVRWSNTNSDGFLPMTGVPHVEVTNTKTSLLRTVFVPPNGVARLML
jgi:type IV fimbrial biogenesis protein FimT